MKHHTIIKHRTSIASHLAHRRHFIFLECWDSVKKTHPMNGSSWSEDDGRKPVIFATHRETDSGSGSRSRDSFSDDLMGSAAFSALAPQKRKSNDLSDLTIDKLDFSSLGFYDREKEVGILRGHFDSVLGAKTERRLILVSGASGVGKTRLAETLRIPTLKQRGLFVRGKFDQNMRNDPYSGIANACAEMLGAMMKLQEKDPNRLKEIRAEIEQTLGSELQLLFEVIPVLAEVVDIDGASSEPSPKSASMSAVSSIDSKNRIHYAFLRFIRIVTKHFNPLIVVLDDLQWADTSSLDLLEVMLTDQQNPKLMVIVLYRSNEVDDTHIFNRYLSAFETKSLGGAFSLDRVSEMGNLNFEAVHEIIQDLLSSDDSRTLGLAQVCIRKTNGNPFFLLCFLSILCEKQLLQFNFGTLSWKWNDDEIDSSTHASENVVELLTRKMEAFPAHLLGILKVAAYLGAAFEVNTLEIVWAAAPDISKNQDDEESALEDLLLKLYSEGLLVRVSGSPPRIGWVHDKVQEAAIELIPESERLEFAQRVGTIMMSKLDEQQLDSVIFVVVNLLNGSSSGALDSETRANLARLNLEASQKAVKVSAFDTAAKFAGTGIDLLPEKAWDENYDLALRLYSVGAKAEGFVGNVTAMDRYCHTVLSQENKPMEDKFDIYHIWIDSLSNRSDIAHAASLLFEILGQFKCRFAKNPVLVGLGVVGNIIRIKGTMKPRDTSKLEPMKDEKRIELMRFLDKLATCCYMLKDDRMPLVVFRSLNWTFKYGTCDFSPPAFATTGMMLTGILDDIQAGSLYGRHALTLLSNSGTMSTSSRTLLCVHSFLLSWTQPLRTLYKPLLQGYDIGLQTG
jgi:predicted ATPase